MALGEVERDRREDLESGLTINEGGCFQVTPAQLAHLIEPRNVEALTKLGGVLGVARMLGVNLKRGLPTSSRAALQEAFGHNVLPHRPSPTLLRLMWEALMDRILLMLIAAAVASLAIGIYQDVSEGTATHWIEGAAILMAVVIVVLVNALNDYQRELQFRRLSARGEDRMVTVRGEGQPRRLSIFQLAVGDVVLLEPGEVVPADGIFIEGYNLQCDEAEATGETEAVHKGALGFELVQEMERGRGGEGELGFEREGDIQINDELNRSNMIVGEEEAASKTIQEKTPKRRIFGKLRAKFKKSTFQREKDNSSQLVNNADHEIGLENGKMPSNSKPSVELFDQEGGVMASNNLDRRTSMQSFTGLGSGTALGAEILTSTETASGLCPLNTRTQEQEEADPFLLSGTKVLDGTGAMLVICVGEYSFHGRMMMAMREDTDATPLQQKLDRLAELIAKLGAAVALLMFFALLTKYAIQLSLQDGAGQGSGLPDASEIFERLLLIAIETITVVVVAVPEGLPMAVTLALAYATTRMLKDNNLVRVLAACETMGNATCICSDKTGTLTENLMTVVKGFLAGLSYERGQEEEMLARLAPTPLGLLKEAIAINSTAFEVDDPITHRRTFVGNKTEAALLQLISKLEADYAAIRSRGKVLEVFPFSSQRKCMITTVLFGGNEGEGESSEKESNVRIHCKGAAEMILSVCTHRIRPNGQLMAIDNEEIRNLKRLITEMAQESLRTIAVAYCEMPREEYEGMGAVDLVAFSNRKTTSTSSGMILLALVGIEDPLRAGVTEAVAACQHAGIFVRMVTGDNVVTAQSIARKCGILMRGGVVLEGARFRALSDAQMEQILPRLQVLARSSPIDKQIMVRKLRAMGEVVAVTGDGTNDGPALKAANVGFAMGISGTEVAKEASSIVLLDDNFSSIVKAVSWGRCVNDSVRKFLQFQLTVNVSAVSIAFLSALVNPRNQSVLTVVQLLWVNLIMDAFAALALATDRPSPSLLDRPPEEPTASLITGRMTRMIISQAIFQIVTIMGMFYFGETIFHLAPLPNSASTTTPTILGTLIFNTFVFMQLFNEINCRILNGGNLNPFQGLFRNHIFISIWLSTALVQLLLVCFGGLAFGTRPLPPILWLVSLGIGFLSLPIALAVRLLPDWPSSSTRFGWDRGGGGGSTTRIHLSRERLHWQAAIGDVRRSLAFYSALRRARRPLSRNSAGEDGENEAK